MLPLIMRENYRPFYMSDFFNDDFFPVLTDKTNSMPAVNIKEDEKNYFVDLAVPGMDKKDIKIAISEDIITISSELKHETSEEKNGYMKKEFNYSSFCRSFYVPENVNRDEIAANYKDGIITVALPKQKEDNRKLSREIAIA